MTDYFTLANEAPEHPGLDFALLRQEGIEFIQKLAGDVWTDYNLHDPGITILEVLCYAMTDLSYRLDFPITDLLAPPGKTEETGNNNTQFFTARQILPVNPLTINDYRKLLIDVEGVRNAWLEKSATPSPEICYDPYQEELTFNTPEIGERIQLNGLYKVFIEKEDSASDDTALIDKVSSKLNQHRNLCEDFEEIRILALEEIRVQAEIEIGEENEANKIMAAISVKLENFISPSVPFYTLEELIAKGKTIEEILSGPRLRHGYIDDDQLGQVTKKTELYTSNLIHIILDIPGVKTVKRITLSGQKGSDKEWALDVDPECAPRLKDYNSMWRDGDLKFFKGEILCPLNKDDIKKQRESLKSDIRKTPIPAPEDDLPIPLGEYCELAEYVSLQSEFPATYGIGHVGLPASATVKRKARAKQLQAYLLFFDQILGNYFAQLDHLKDLFSIHHPESATYFAQMLSDVPGVAELLNIDANGLQDLTEDPETALTRRNRFLDHLMARFCEQFPEYSFLLAEDPERCLQHKAAFLRDYPQIGAERGKAFDYTDNQRVWETDNVAGLKKRISRMLGFPDYKRKNLASSGSEGFHISDDKSFHIVEHLLLRPGSEAPEHQTRFLTFAHSISDFAASTKNPDQVTCSSPNHGLAENDRIKIFETTHYNGIYTVADVTDDTFNIEKSCVATESGRWVRADHPRDPYSFQLSFVFPEPIRVQDENELENLKSLIEHIVVAETPAHITPYIHWLDGEKMCVFEDSYRDWLQKKAENSSEIQEAADRLIELLHIGAPPIPVDGIET